METLKITSSRFKYDGLYSLSSYYNLLYDVFRTMGYDVEEWKYRNKVGPDGTTVELELFWTARRKVDNYARIVINCKTLIVTMSKQQTQIDGKPIMRDKGTLELELKCAVELDYENKWMINPVLNQLRRIYNNVLYKPVLTVIKTKAGGEMGKVDSEMKAFFNMQG
jgi:hypothetical protein